MLDGAVITTWRAAGVWATVYVPCNGRPGSAEESPT
jgi:hypothetical protein